MSVGRALLLLTACAAPPAPPPQRAADPPPARWPDAPLRAPALEVPEGWRAPRLLLDAGHGAPDNLGNLGSRCQWEQDFTLDLAHDLARTLQHTGRFDVRVSRQGNERVPYPTRVQQAEAWPADLIISLHSDVRGGTPSAQATAGCPSGVDSPGYSVLYSDDAPAPLREQRARAARTLARHLDATGLGACDCDEYSGLYERDPEHDAVFIDRHQPGSRIYLLRRPRVPSLILETHNAWDPQEVQRWQEPATRDVIARALIGALFELYAPEPRDED
jgi:N-acetylmuramoyl-L-alanine amidase